MTESEQQPQTRHVYGLRLALLAGIILWLACPARSIWPLTWVGVSPLIIGVMRAKRLRQAVWRGYLFGWVYLGAVWYWTGVTIVNWTHSDVGWLAWFGLTLVLAGFYAAWAGIVWSLSRVTEGWGRILMVAAAWVAMEWLRTAGNLGMPWAQLSYSQTALTPLIQIASVTGAYGVSFIVALFNATIAEWWRDRSVPGGVQRIWAAAGVAILVCLLGLLRLAGHDSSPRITVADMQPNFRVLKGLTTLEGLQVLRDLSAAAHEFTREPIALFVWPESAAPQDAVHDYHVYSVLRDLSLKYDAAITIGSRVVDPLNRREFNSSVLLTPDGASLQRYDKRHLVPFGEYIPFREILPSYLDTVFQFPPNDVTPGEPGVAQSFTAPGNIRVRPGPFICYESLYPCYARDMTRSGANLLITQSNDDWFQSDSAMEQHLSAVVLRAVENGRTIVRSTQTGITCIVDSNGRVVARAPQYHEAFLVRSVGLSTSMTIYTRFGDWFAWLCFLAVLGHVGRAITLRRAKARASAAGVAA